MSYILLPEERRVLRKLRKCSLRSDQIYNFSTLLTDGHIAENLTGERDGFGAYIGDGTYHLTDAYWRYIYERREKLRSWLVPVMISAAALLISFVALFK